MGLWRIGIYAAIGLGVIALAGFIFSMAVGDIKLFAVSALLGLAAVAVLVVAVLTRARGSTTEE